MNAFHIAEISPILQLIKTVTAALSYCKSQPVYITTHPFQNGMLLIEITSCVFLEIRPLTKLLDFCSRTSPVSVPISLSRQRNESTSSVGSWQMISQSGSLRSTDSGNLLQHLRAQNTNSQESSSTLIEDELFTSSNQTAMYVQHITIIPGNVIPYIQLRHSFISLQPTKGSLTKCS